MMNRLLALAWACVVVLLARPAPAEERPQLDFAQIGDPQIGYGVGGVRGGAQRFSSLVRELNEAGVPLVVIPGDLVQSRSFLEHWAFERTLGGLRADVLLVPGNHDVVDVASLADYRRRYGRDYYVREAPGAKFVVVDSETARTPRLSAHEFATQWQFIEAALPAASGARTESTPAVFVITHRPPFVDSEDEADGDANWPLATRARLLALCRRAGVESILAGHLHRDHQVETHDGIEVSVLCGSARCFDQSPIGYRHHRAGGADWVRVGSPPPSPISVPYLREWTPRLFDFSLRHWLLTLLFALTGWSAWRAARPRAPSSLASAPFAWVALALFFFALNMQLDFDEMLRELGRIAAKLTGVYALRHTLSLAVLAVMALAALVKFVSHARQGLAAREAAALAGCVVPSAWFALSVISHHDLGMLWDELIWDALTLVSLIVVAWASGGLAALIGLQKRLRR